MPTFIELISMSTSPNVWLTDVFLIAFGQHWRRQTDASVTDVTVDLLSFFRREETEIVTERSEPVYLAFPSAFNRNLEE